MSPNHWAARLAVARGFARYLQTIDPATEIPPAGVFPARRNRPTPYLWSQADIARLLDGARALRSPIRAATHQALFGLLAVSGMRVGEATGLDRGDIDFETGVVTIRHAKHDRTRLVPLHETAVAALDAYATERDRLCSAARSDAFFVSNTGTRLTPSGIAKTLRQITTDMGIRDATTAPTAHQLRHSFAVRTLIDWQQSGVSIDGHIAILSTYLGHIAVGHLLVFVGVPRADGHRSRTARHTVRSPNMTDLAPSLQAFFTDRLIGQRCQPEHHRLLQDHLRAAPPVRFSTDRDITQPTRHRRSRRAACRSVPRAPGDRTAQHTKNTEQPARSDPLAVRLPRPPPPRTRRDDPTGARHPHQTHPTEPPHLPDRTRSRRAPPSMRPTTLDRPT